MCVTIIIANNNGVNIMKAYKGFNKDMTCRGFQFKEGETYETEEAKLCECGFHACEAPIDVFKYYPPASSVYHKVELEDVSDECSDDTKVCAKKIKIGAKLSIEKLIELQIEYTKAHCTNEHHAGLRSPATAGDYDIATVDSYGAATVDEDSVATVGDRGAVTAGAYSVATAGNGGAATVRRCGAATVGDFGAANAGYRSVAVAGDFGVAKAEDVSLATAGYCGIAMAENNGVAKAGEFGVAASRGHSSVGENGLAFARGNNVRVRGELGSVIVIVEEQDLTYDIREWKAGVIDGKTLKPNTWYKLKNGEFVECE